MHTIKLQVQDSIYSHVMFFLQNLNTRELKIIEDTKASHSKIMENSSDINAFTNHSANLIDEWKDVSEDEIWK
jgi:hypothetical protein